MNPDKKNIHLQSCTTRLVVGDLSYCPVKCVTGQFDGMYVMDGRDCNWPKPNIKICDNGFVVNNFIAKCPIKCIKGKFDGFYVVDIKKCNNNPPSYLPSSNQQNNAEVNQQNSATNNCGDDSFCITIQNNNLNLSQSISNGIPTTPPSISSFTSSNSFSDLHESSPSLENNEEEFTDEEIMVEELNQYNEQDNNKDNHNKDLKYMTQEYEQDNNKDNIDIINKKLIKQEISEIKRMDSSNQHYNNLNDKFKQVNLFGFGLKF
jgi:hypothetical protein